MCGGDLGIPNPETPHIAICTSCNTKQTISVIKDEKNLNIIEDLNDANFLRREGLFDASIKKYKSLLPYLKYDSEIYFNIALCEYGIRYVDDPKTKRSIPTINFLKQTPFLSDENYKLCLKYSDLTNRDYYLEEGRKINELQIKMLNVSKNIQSFDIFLCYKQTDDVTNKDTQDSVIAKEIYDILTEQKYNVFFAKETLKDKLGEEFEPYIYSALNSAKIMFVIGTRKDYLDAVWVKNEYTRFIEMKSNLNYIEKFIIPCFKNIQPSELPVELKVFQGISLDDENYKTQILNFVDKTFTKKKTAEVLEEISQNNFNNYDSYLIKAIEFLNKGNFQEASQIVFGVLAEQPKNAYANYLCLLCENNVKNDDELLKVNKQFSNTSSFLRAYEYGNESLKNNLSELAKKHYDSYSRQETEIINQALEFYNQGMYEYCYDVLGELRKSKKANETLETLKNNKEYENQIFKNNLYKVNFKILNRNTSNKAFDKLQNSLQSILNSAIFISYVKKLEDTLKIFDEGNYNEVIVSLKDFEETFENSRTSLFVCKNSYQKDMIHVFKNYYYNSTIPKTNLIDGEFDINNELEDYFPLFKNLESIYQKICSAIDNKIENVINDAIVSYKSDLNKTIENLSFFNKNDDVDELIYVLKNSNKNNIDDNVKNFNNKQGNFVKIEELKASYDDIKIAIDSLSKEYDKESKQRLISLKQQLLDLSKQPNHSQKIDDLCKYIDKKSKNRNITFILILLIPLIILIIGVLILLLILFI